MALFGGMPIPVQFFLAFVIVLGLIGATAWLVRRFGAGALGGPSMRGRQPRLAVLEHTLVEGRRRLYLVRRDNVEHLLLIGGPTDIVVEPNIVRAAPAQREAGAPRPPSTIEALPRAIPLPDNAAINAWPLQPEPAALAPRPLRHEQSQETAWSPQGEAPPRAQRDTLAALADELSMRTSSARNRPQTSARAQAFEQRPEPHAAPPQHASPPAPGQTDQALAAMANRLETALRKPAARGDGRDTRAPAIAPRAKVSAEPVAPGLARPVPNFEPIASPPAAPQPQPAAPIAPAQPGQGRDAHAPQADPAQPSGDKTRYDNLEQEMASLLGRPTTKT